MPRTRPKGSFKTPGSGRRAGTPNRRTVAMANAMREAAKGTKELPHEFSFRIMRYYGGLAEKIILDPRASVKLIETAHEYLEMARLFARDAAQFFAPKMVRTDADVKAGETVVNLVQFDFSKIPKTTPLPDLIEHHSPEGIDLDFDDPEPVPLARNRNGGRE